MNQINIDSLLSIGNSTKIEPQLRLDSTQLYQALLKIGSDGNGQLHVAAGSTAVKIALSQADLQQLSRSTTAASSQVILSNSNNQVNAQAPLDGSIWQVKLQPVSENHIRLELQKPAQQLPISEAAIFKWLQQVAQQLQPASKSVDQAQALQLQVQVTRHGNKLLVSIDASRPQLALPLPQLSEKQQALLNQIPQSQQRLSAQNGLLNISFQQGQMQLRLELSVLAQQKSDNQHSLQSIATGTPQTGTTQTSVTQTGLSKAGHDSNSASATLVSNPSAQTGKAQSTLATAAGSLSTAIGESALLRNHENSAVQNRHRQSPASHPQDAHRVAQESKLSIVFEREQLKTVLPALTKQMINQGLTLQNQQLAISDRLTAKSASLNPEQWQLKTNSAQWLVEVQANSSVKDLKVSLLNIDKPLFWQQNPMPANNKLAPAAASVDIPMLWRQLLPLTSAVDPLKLSPELPAGVQALLQELKANTLDHQKIPAAAELHAQLTAAMQFSPQQSQPNAMTAAGSLAIALQLLIGRLVSTASEANKPSAGKEKLQQIIGQLNESQSGQLLRQLSGHSAQLQQAQFANLEQQAQAKTEHSQLFIQLPVLVQGQNQFVELAISEREADGNSTGSKKRAWQLTMKFQLPEQGHLLVQVHLVDTTVSMQFYAETEQTQQLASQWLPLFKDRLKVQGLDIKEIQVQRGKIPEHLYQRGTSLLQVKV
jgi:hypothetical protein